MTPIELRARREALGLSQSGLADLLRTKQNTISQWEKGTRAIPALLDDELAVVEDAVQDLCDRYIDDALQGDAGVLVAHDEPTAFWAAHPDLAGRPPLLGRVAAGRALVELRADGIDVDIVTP